MLGNDALLDCQEFLNTHQFALGTGHQFLKRQLASKVMESGGTLETVIHPSAIIASFAEIGPGSFVAAGAVIATNARLGRFCLINTGSSVDHDCVLDDGVQMSPGTRLAGQVHCGEDVFFGTNATVIPRLRIGARSIVGAGAVVIRDVPPAVVVAGNPARIIKNNASDGEAGL